MKLIPILAVTLSFAGAAFAQTMAPTVQGQAAMGVATAGAAAGADAQSVYSAAEVGAARRYFRAQCSRYEPADTCECVGAGIAQTLSPNEVRLAAADVAVRAAKVDTVRAKAVLARNKAAARLGFPGEEARTVAMARIQKLEADLMPICTAATPT
jgi:hypothetical protein